MNLKITIIAKEGVAYEGEASAIFVPTMTGIIEVLPNHTQLISALKEGEIILKTVGSDTSSRGASKKIKVSGGVLEVRPNSHVVILADIVKDLIVNVHN